MSEKLIKPYEISVWEDKIVTDNESSHFEENKILVIGSDTMDSPNKVYEPILKENLNGEKTLTFSLKYKYFDPVSEAMVINPFSSFLINERKVKLYYNDKWYEFIIKNHSESDDGMEWTYSCVDAFVLELSKTGYNLEFSADLNNNQGTAEELSYEVLKNTEWTVEEGTVGKQKIEEPIYKAVLNNTDNITIKNVDTGEIVTLEPETEIYVFYSYVANKNGKFVQFTLQSDVGEIDDKGNYIATNYRILEELEYEEQVFSLDGFAIIIVDEIEILHHSYRLVYNQRTAYDPVMKRTVDIFNIEPDSIAYRYKDYVYSTSDVAVSYVTNGENFEPLDSGAPQGWSQYTDFESGGRPGKLKISTYPYIDKDITFESFANYGGVEGFLQAQFNGIMEFDNPDPTQNFLNTVFNSGFEDNAAMLTSISKGQSFVFRWRAGCSVDEHDKPEVVPNNHIGCLVAKYNKEYKTGIDEEGNEQSYYVNVIDPDGIILRFEGEEQELNNIIDNGYFQVDVETNKKVSYVVNGVVQTPSTKYIYISQGEPEVEYVWDNVDCVFVQKTEDYLNYKYLIGTAQQSVSNSELTDPNIGIGIFIYLCNGADYSKYYSFSDVQITKYIEDSEGNVVTIGNIPTALAYETEYYYLKPSEGAAAEDIETYTQLNAFADGIGVPVDAITPDYNEDSEKVLSITASKSNCFNVLQTIAETFEAWLKIDVEHEEDGRIKIIDGKPVKKISFHEFIGKNNYAGFKYGVNLTSIERTVESDEIVTKLIVDAAQSDYVDDGVVSIQLADANPSGESYIFNFNYLYNKGLITDKEACQNDISEFNETVKDLNSQIQQLESEKSDLVLSLTKINSNRTVFNELLNAAKDHLNVALADFKKATGRDFKDYEGQASVLGDIYVKATTVMAEYDPNAEYYKLEGPLYVRVFSPTLSEFQADLYFVKLVNIFQQDAIYDIIGEIYNSYSVINNYGGLLTNINEEYKRVKEELYGDPEYSFTATIVPNSGNTKTLKVYLNDYLVPFSFTVNEIRYETTVNKKTFDIPIEDSSYIIISDILAPNYIIYDNSGQAITSAIIHENRVYKFKIRPEVIRRGKEEEIKELQNSKNIVVSNFLNKYSRFIQEGNWSSINYVDSNLYYFDALQISNNFAEPKISYNINVVEISEIEGFEQYNFSVGDKTWVEDEEFFGWNSTLMAPAREEVVVSEIEWHLEEPDKNVVTIQNYKTQFEDLFQRLTATVQTVQYNEAAYTKTSSIVNPNGTLNEDMLVTALNAASGRKFALTSDGSVYVEGDAVHIQNLTNAANHVILNSEGIRVSEDGGLSWTTAISGRGINLETLFAGTINTDSIYIGGQNNPSFRWDKMGLSAYSINEDNTYDLTTYVRFDENGLYGIKNDADFKATSIDDVKDKAHFGITWDGFFIKNSYTNGRVEITSDEDFRVLQTIHKGGLIFDTERIKIGALDKDSSGIPTKYGIRIKNDDGLATFETGDDGNIYISGFINALGGDFSELVTVGKEREEPYVLCDESQTVIKPNTTYYERGTYNLTEDTSVETGVTYYELISYVAIAHPQGNPYEQGWYRKVGNIYVPCGPEETVVVEGVTYYELLVPGYYKIINNPQGNPQEQEWYTKDYNDNYQEVIYPYDAGSGSGNPYLEGWYLPNDIPYIAIDGTTSEIYSSNYQDGAGNGWKINATGDATFNNITIRGAVKTAVFEYGEIEAVGGAFLFRPSSTIRNARVSDDEQDLVLVVEQPMLFNKGTYVKVSNINSDVDNVLNSNGLIHVYKISDLRVIKINEKYIPCEESETTIMEGVDYYEKQGDEYILVTPLPDDNPYEEGWYRYSYEEITELKLAHGLNILRDIKNLNSLIGGALISLVEETYEYVLCEETTVIEGVTYYKKEGDIYVPVTPEAGDNPHEEGWYKQRTEFTNSYGVGINSSDNFVNLPPRAISLFDSSINEEASSTDVKVAYKYRGILGTLPEINRDVVDNNIYRFLQDKQGIYTNNLYIGDKDQYIAFYSENDSDNTLKIRAKEIIYDVQDNQEISWESYLLDNKLKYFWQNLIGMENYPAGTYMVAGNQLEFDRTNANTYGFNSFMDSKSLSLRYNRFNLIQAEAYSGLTISLSKIQDKEIIDTTKKIQINATNGIVFYDANGENSIAEYTDELVRLGQHGTSSNDVYLSLRNSSDANVERGLSLYQGNTRIVNFGDSISFDTSRDFLIGDDKGKAYIKYARQPNGEYDITIKASNFYIGTENQQLNQVIDDIKGELNGYSDIQGSTEDRFDQINQQFDEFRGRLLLDTGNIQVQPPEEPKIIINNGVFAKQLILETNLISFNNKNSSTKISPDRIESTTLQVKDVVATNTKATKVDIVNNKNESMYWIMRNNGHLSLKL